MAREEKPSDIDAVIQRVAVAFPDVPVADVERVVATMHTRFQDAKVVDFVPLLVERRARAVLSHRSTVGRGVHLRTVRARSRRRGDLVAYRLEDAWRRRRHRRTSKPPNDSAARVR